MSIPQIKKLESQVWNTDDKDFFNKSLVVLPMTNSDIGTESDNPLRLQQTASGYYTITGRLNVLSNIPALQQFIFVSTFPSDFLLANFFSMVTPQYVRNFSVGDGSDDKTVAFGVSTDNPGLRIFLLGQSLDTNHQLNINLTFFSKTAPNKPF